MVFMLPGLWAAAQALSQVGEVFVVAPDREQSGVGASLTLHAPVVARSLEIPALGRLSAAANEEAASADDQQAEIRHRGYRLFGGRDAGGQLHPGPGEAGRRGGFGGLRASTGVPTWAGT